jgi:vitamin B12 transporter
MSSTEELMIERLLALLAAQPEAPPAPPGDDVIIADYRRDDIVVTANLGQPHVVEAAPASATLVLVDQIRALDLPHAADLLRLTPGVVVAVAGPAGSQSQLRIRGAEANHSLLFVDGIRFNDPASGNEARFELLTSELVQRIEVVRGPQSALWGADALGGVIAVDTGGGPRPSGATATVEVGSFESVRASAHGVIGTEEARLSIGGALLQSAGIDSFGVGGERDGFVNRTLSAHLSLQPHPWLSLGLVGHHVEGRSEFDGFDPATFARADTLGATDNRISALGASAEARLGAWEIAINLSHLDSANANRLGDEPLNRSAGDRTTASTRASYRFGSHQLTALAEVQAEGFSARDTQFFGGTDQDRAREIFSLAGEWQAQWTPWLRTDLAIRHDDFSDFADATTWRAAIQLRPAPDLTLHAAYGEGIAQPTFYDLFGFFPGSFRGNPGLLPEGSQAWEASLRYARAEAGLSASITYFEQDLTNEIVDIFDPVTFVSSTANADGESRRRGIEAELNAQLAHLGRLRLSYAYIDADEQRTAGGMPVREVRRPRHSGSLTFYGRSGPLSWSASAAFVGERTDTDFSRFPAVPVTLDSYVLASARIAYALPAGFEAFARVENGFDADYQDVVGYFTPGAAVYAGIRLSFGD